MQAHTQLSGQVSGAQLSGVSQQNAASLPSQGLSRRRTWQTDADVTMRRTVVDKILKVCQRKGNFVNPSMQQKLPDLVKRLEEALYRDASSKEEYCDLSTLEHRLQAVGKRMGSMRANPNVAARGLNAASSMIPTPGVPAMIPTPGHEAATPMVSGSGTVNCNFSGTDNSMALPSNIGNMIPTPGLSAPLPAMSGSSMVTSHGKGVTAGSGQNGQAQTQQQQLFSSGLNGQMHGTVNGALPGNAHRGCINGNQSHGLQHMNNGQQHLSNVHPGYPNPSSLYTNSSNFGNLSARSQQQQMTQLRQQHMPMQGDRFATDHAGTGAFYNSMSTGFPSSSMGMHCHGTSKMIPVPGLPPQPQTQAKVSASSKNLQQQQHLNGKASLQTSFESDSSQPASLVSQEEGSQVGPSLTFQSLLDCGQSRLPQQVSKVPHQQQRHPPAEFRHQQHMTQNATTGSQPLRCQVGQNQEQNQQQEPAHQHNRNQLLQVSSSGPPRHVFSLDDVEEPRQEAANGGLSDSQAGTGCRASASSTPGTASSEHQRAQQYIRQQRWLLFLRHASKCVAPEGQCQQTPHCHTARQLWAHIIKCIVRECQYPRCVPSRTLLKHHQNCKDPDCPVCVPVRQRLRMQAGQSQAVHATSSASTAKSNILGSLPGAMHGQMQSNKSQTLPPMPLDVQQPPAKRAKVEVPEQSAVSCTMASEVHTMASVVKTEGHTVSVKVEEGGLCVGIKSDAHGRQMNNPTLHIEPHVKVEDSSKCEDKAKVEIAQPVVVKCEPSSTVTNKVSLQVKQEVKEEAAVHSSSSGPEHAGNAKSCKSKNKGVSLIELFTPEQIREHISSLRQWVGQSKAKAEKNQAMEHQMNENSCQLCAVETLTFEPPPIYCTPCGVRIKRNFPYWTMQCGETRHYFCIPCCSDVRSDTVVVDGTSYSKSKLEKRRNDEETEEPWVQCDKCEKWQHQVCALFNMRRNEGGQAEYTCPNCLLTEMEKGERKPLPQSAVLGAKDLPKTFLSDHIEQRLARRLKQERLERARAQGKSYNEVPGADSLVVRVVSSVDKKLEVKPHFLEMFQEEDYPTEFPYKSKVLLLFQRIEGVEVCLFGMYVQEFGAEAAQPNQRRVYLSYLDSVKYFRPDVRTVSGEALRTFVYHEILIGYLDYCKRRGFTSCYIWACPPLKGEDYILYCHPEIQKTPKSDKLRDWYLAMLFKATNEGIVADITNMYDHFFVCTGEAKAKVTAARLPYFDGDYWPGAAEEMIMSLQKEESGQRLNKKGKTKSAMKRGTKTTAQAELASNASKDLQLMHKLGESIHPMKDDFIMVHMQYACTHCCSFIISGCRWTCRQCKSFNICERCYAAEQKLDEWARHPMSSKDAHQLVPIPSTETLLDTKDKDEIMESEFFDTRQAFLSLCQGNHYQYDTLRRAKNSSMMVLYHLHNPTAPAYVTTCNICHRDIETGQGWRCETCPDFDICNPCYSMDDSIKHPHKLVPHPSAAERDAQSKEARQQRVVQLRKMLELLVHASQCGSAQQCQYPNCRRVKALFRHGFSCKTRASGGCQLCKRMWYLLQLHSRACKEAECRVPRCKDLKEHLRRLQQQQESRRRNAVMEMMRLRAAGATT
eukprot:c20351_g2_i1 orf=875-5692(+)